MFNAQSSKPRSLHAVEWHVGLAPLIINYLHLVLQSHPFHRSIWAILRANMGEIETLSPQEDKERGEAFEYE